MHLKFYKTAQILNYLVLVCFKSDLLPGSIFCETLCLEVLKLPKHETYHMCPSWKWFCFVCFLGNMGQELFQVAIQGRALNCFLYLPHHSVTIEEIILLDLGTWIKFLM